MYDTRFKGSFKAVPICGYKPHSIRKRTLGSISCNTTTSCPLQPIPLNWVPLELLQDSDSSSEAIGPHWPSSYPDYLSPDWDKDEQQMVVWARLQSQRFKLASWLSKQNKHYLTLCQDLNLRTTQVKSSHNLLYHDTCGEFGFHYFTCCCTQMVAKMIFEKSRLNMSHPHPSIKSLQTSILLMTSPTFGNLFLVPIATFSPYKS